MNNHYKVEIGDGSQVIYCDTYRKVLTCLLKVSMQNRAKIQKTKTFSMSFGISVREYYNQRKKYVALVRLCDDTMEKVKRLGMCARRDRLFERFALAYSQANDIVEKYPEVWQGEV